VQCNFSCSKQKGGALPPQIQHKQNNNRNHPTNINMSATQNNPFTVEKKETKEMPNAYNPPFVEASWYDWWEKSGFFKADNQDTRREKFVIVIPPPNVTGALHLGHALTVSIQDCICRWRRMQGKNVLYLPGVDHAGIATQVVVEKMLYKETGKTRHELGREKFVEKVWEWKENYGQRIKNQLRRTGASLDWSRERFTMDEQLSRAVNEAFVRMYEKGIIYRDTKLVNWCCKLKTAISNIEVEHEEFDKPKKLSIPGHPENKYYEFGMIWSFAYKVENSDQEIVVSTTRPETMLGDTAVAVHPDDERYKSLHGKYVIHPFNGRRIPIITDKVLVDPNFGTGAVKITPAHDPNDYECGKRHNLEFINIFTDDGHINENGAPFQGMLRFEAREAVVKGLEEKGLFRGKEPHKLSIGKCSRSGDIIEPMLKPQWYLDCKNLAKLSVQKVKDGELKIIPEREKDTWYRWLENIQDWCISRQLWWGHRIPAYLVHIKGREIDRNVTESWVVARTREEAQKQAAQRFGLPEEEIVLEQDEDVLDTWFSSGLFPFSTMGWPNEEDPDFKAFYPNQMLETGLDILFFWVARMVMMGLELTGKLPFETVLLHALVRDKDGKKMSKSLGNVIDPIDVIQGISLEELHKQLYIGNLSQTQIEKAIKLQKNQFPEGIPECGTDALRFTLLNYSTPEGRDINLDVMRVYGYRTFCNKIWNATKFALMNLVGFEPKLDELPNINDRNLSFADKWILSRLNRATKQCDDSLERYDFSTYTSTCYDFFLKEFCDVYLEAIKPVMYLDANENEHNAARKKASQLVLFTVLEQSLRLMHPAMPFITEELWQRLPHVSKLPKNRESIMINQYPTPIEGWTSDQIEKDMNFVNDVIHKIRSAKANYNLTNKQKPEVYAKVNDEHLANLIKDQASNISLLGYSGPISVITSDKEVPEGSAIEVVNSQCELYVALKGMIDFKVELNKQKKNREKLQVAYDGLLKKMNLPGYSDKVPENIRMDDKNKAEAWKMKLQKFDKAIEDLQRLIQ
jgi:valyl-tRNA synthetase